MAAKKSIFISRHSILAKIWKTTFPKEFFNEIWLKLGDHEYIKGALDNILKFYFRLNFIYHVKWNC